MDVRSMAPVCVLALVGLAGCDQPGPLSAAANPDLMPPPPPQPAWSAALSGKPLKSAFPAQVRCIGFVDGVRGRFRGAREIIGWGWSLDGGQALARVAAVDDDGRMVGFGEGGISRPDVPAARPEVRSPVSGWVLLAPSLRARYRIYGLDAARRGACDLGMTRG